MSHGKKRLWILIPAILVLLLIGLLLWQRENLTAAVQVVTKDSETITKTMEETRESHQESLVQNYQVTVTPPSTEDSDALLDGAVTSDEVKQELGLTEVLNQAEAAEESEEPIDVQQLIDACVAELYAYKVELMAQLGGLKEETIKTWKDLPKEERTSAKKRQLIAEGLKQCYALETTADSHVQEILARYQEKFEQLGADTQITEDLWMYYCDEKSSEKAYYMEQYLK